MVSVLLIALFATMAIWPQLFTDLGPRACELSRSTELPSADHWFGFDRQGCDYFTRVVYGARASIAVGLLVTLGAFVIAVTLGTLAGYYGGLIDSLLARFADIWFGIPLVLGAIVLLTAVENRGVTQVASVLIVLSWPPMIVPRRSWG